MVKNPDLEAARRAVEAVLDPELPLLTIGELGIVRRVEQGPQATVEVVLTPTYMGCPAVDVIAEAVRDALEDAGYPFSTVRWELRPAWSTDDITPSGRAKLATGGIAPPPCVGASLHTAIDVPVACPHCGSRRTRAVSAFGSTACKSAYVCQACTEPFERFKPL